MEQGETESWKPLPLMSYNGMVLDDGPIIADCDHESINVKRHVKRI